MNAAAINSGQPQARPITVADLGAFLVAEAALLDEWRLDEWLKLMEEGARYLIPPMDKPDGDYHDTLFLVSDDTPTLRSRVKQLLGRATSSENPRSRTRRLVTNFRVAGTDGEVTLAEANFAVWRFQNEQSDTYVGRYVHKLVRSPAGSIQFRERKTILDLHALRPHGKISFIL